MQFDDGIFLNSISYSSSSLLHFDPELGSGGLAYSGLLFLKGEAASNKFLKRSF